MSEVTFIKKVTPAKDNKSGTVNPSNLPSLEVKDHSTDTGPEATTKDIMEGATNSSPEGGARHIKDARGNLNPDRVTQKDNNPAEKSGVKPLGDKFLPRGCYRTVSCVEEVALHHEINNTASNMDCEDAESRHENTYIETILGHINILSSICINTMKDIVMDAITDTGVDYSTKVETSTAPVTLWPE